MIKKAKFAAMLLSGALLCATAVCATDTVAVNAAGTYLRIPDAADTVIDDAQKTPIKYGNYYFKKNAEGYLLVSFKKNTGYKTLDIYYHSTHSDGKTLYAKCLVDILLGITANKGNCNQFCFRAQIGDTKNQFPFYFIKNRENILPGDHRRKTGSR